MAARIIAATLPLAAFAACAASLAVEPLAASADAPVHALHGGYRHNSSHREEYFQCIPQLSTAPLPASCLSKLGNGGLTGDFNVISFSDFYSKGGDIEGRVFVADVLNITGGFSIGDKLSAERDHLRKYSLVAGGAVCWSEGSLFPDGDWGRYHGNKEYFFAADEEATRSCTVPYLRERQGSTGKCPTDDLGCLDTCASDLYAYYNNLADTWANASMGEHNQDNRLGYWQVEHEVGLVLRCQNRLTEEAIFRVPNSVWSRAYYQRLHHCDVGSQHIVIVIANDDNKVTTFNHGDLPSLKEKTVFVLPGTGPDVVVEGAVYGSVLAPQRAFRQEHGVVERGFLIAGDIRSLHQVNKPRCQAPDICGCCNICK